MFENQPNNTTRTTEKPTSESVLESIRQIPHRLTNLEGQIGSIKGIALGLFYGIVGNMFVSHFYGLLEGALNGNYGFFFLLNLLVSLSTFILIVSVSVISYCNLQTLTKEKDALSKEFLRLVNQLLGTINDKSNEV